MLRQRYLILRFYRLIILVAVLLSLAICTAAASDRYVLITLLHTNDMHGSVMPENGTSGLAKIATMVKRVRTDMPNVVLMDAGDIIHGTFEDYLSGGKATISSMNAVGYEAATFGNHEFDFGTNTTKGAAAAAVFPFTSANVKSSANDGLWNGFNPYIIKTVDGVKIAVFGLSTPQTIDLEWPARIAEVKFIDPFQTASQLVPELHKQADVVVALSHLGYAADTELAKKVPGIDFIIGGHSHTILDKWTWVGNTMITQAGAMGTYLGRIDFIVKVGDAGSTIASVNGKYGWTWSKLGRTPLGKSFPDSPLLAVTADIPDDPAVVEAYTPYRQKARTLLDEVVGETTGGFTTTSDTDESPAGNLVTDAVRWAMTADIAAVDPASIAGGIPPGKITVETAFRLIGGYTRQNLVKVEMTGQAIQDALAFYLSKRKSPPLMVSGMTVNYRMDERGIPVIDQVFIGGAPLDPSKVYTAASQAYVIMDWQKRRPDIKVVSDPDITTREAIVNYIRNMKTVEYKPEGRVKRVES